MFAPTALVAGVGLWHVLHEVHETQAYSEKVQVIKETERKKKIAQGLETYHRVLQQDPFLPPITPPKQRTILPPMEEPKTDYALCAFIMAAICGTLSQNHLHGVSWAMVTPVTVVAVLTVILALSKNM